MIKKYCIPAEARQEGQSQLVSIRGLTAELNRVTEERDILKKAAAYLPASPDEVRCRALQGAIRSNLRLKGTGERMRLVAASTQRVFGTQIPRS